LIVRALTRFVVPAIAVVMTTAMAIVVIVCCLRSRREAEKLEKLRYFLSQGQNGDG
jgi:hypothetical protein